MKNKTRILLVDIETFPNVGFIWGKYEQDVIEYVKESILASFSVKWLGESKIEAFALPDFKTYYKKNPESDRELAKKLWEYFNEADIIIAHNGDRFDIKKSNAYFIENGLTPPSPYKTVDTRKIAKKYFMFNSNKLDDLGNYLHLGRKIQTGGFGLWKGCMSGDMTSWKKMVKYNKQDIVLLEQVYYKLLPWITNHPSVSALHGEKTDCPNCGSDKLQKRGFIISGKGKRQRFQCQECAAWSQGAIIK